MTAAHHVIFIAFLFALGACVGSFLNVVVWRLPRIEHGPNDLSIFGSLWKTFQGLSHPPSHCPKCNKLLKWYDNIPVIGWIKLGGKCRFCSNPISPRYPIVEAICGLLFVFYYVMFFMGQIGPCAARPILIEQELLGEIHLVPRALNFLRDWPMFLLYMALVSGLVASSLIDAELFIIPVEIPWVLGVVGIVVHTFIDHPSVPGALNANPALAAMGIGGGVGLLISIALWAPGIIPHSFPEGEPMQDVGEGVEEPPPREGPIANVARLIGQAFKILFPALLLGAVASLYFTQSTAIAVGGTIALLIAIGFWSLGWFPTVTEEDHPPMDESAPPSSNKEWGRRELLIEMRKEMAFLLPPMLLAALWWIVATKVSPVAHWWDWAVAHDWFSGFAGAVLGALVGAFVVWVTRILGTLAFGRLAMGLGDVHLMFGVGAIVGAGAATVAFFLAPFFGILIAIYMLLTGTKREIPYGPYLSIATAAVLLFGCEILNYLTPGVMGLNLLIRGAL